MPSLPQTHTLRTPPQQHAPPDTTHAFYVSPAWRRLRKLVLDDEPLCRECRKAGRITEAVLVDHMTPISKGGAKLDRRNLAPLCAHHHNVKRATEDKR
jgi:5-methylcytosine-specific restriction protein A